MRFLFSSGLLSTLTTGISLLRGSREAPITWRAALAWLSWGITLALAIGTIVDANRESRGIVVASDSPAAARQAKQNRKIAKAQAKANAQN